MLTPRSLPAALPLLVLTLASCSSTAPIGSAADSTAPSAASSAAGLGDGHGAIAGSEEVPDPPLHLVTVDPAGSVDMLDLADETVETLAGVQGVTAIATDGRYVFASAAATGSLTVIDTGMWTWDHEDHFHYYRGPSRLVGTVEGEGEAVVTPGSTTTGVFFPDSGDAQVLDNDALARGELDVVTEITMPPHDGLAVPLSGFTLLTVPGADGVAASVQAHDGDGAPVDGASAPCAAAGGTITTTVGAVIGCEDGALLATHDGGTVTFERIPYPDGADAPRATAFRAREGRPTVAATAGDQGAWLLDTRRRAWQFIPTDVPLLRVSSVDDREGHVVALAADGRVLVLSATTGATLAATEPLLTSTPAGPALPDGVDLIADQQRAYLNAPAERTLFEIDFADGARIARTFETATVPAFLVETGR
ncbi:ABC transporter [Arthrobacter agilis]|uniref:hypothetical protein n=1 Tax=Arthrobacter agilis TaxID=37921 RepID=UPI000B3589DF|nr:hypothetical protein [Arthrobacter agilis]OUM42217.1 hypothetical protein B8W74_08905 [Arthrobacter agilis]PPB45560.1 ABC transporter [Arthrobacter agilis]TPV26460.1 ABC transporter [Arthrobacter agilis]VDR33639.1 Uncharacterised protein [Arthrobacter agilis]